MSRIASLLAWIACAVVSSALYGYVAVYVLGRFDRGYGQLAYFQLSLYIAMISVLAGSVGYAAVTGFRRRSMTLVATAIAGVAFAAAVRGLAFALEAMYPDRDVTVHGVVGALVIGAMTAFVGRAHARESIPSA